MTGKDRALARLRTWTAAYQEENPFSMHPLTAQDWERALEQAAEDAAEAGASEDEIERAWHE